MVGSDVGQVKDLIPEEYGDLIPIGDQKSMAISLKNYLDSPDTTRQSGSMAREWVLNNATWKIRASQVLELVEEVK